MIWHGVVYMIPSSISNQTIYCITDTRHECPIKHNIASQTLITYEMPYLHEVFHSHVWDTPSVVFMTPFQMNFEQKKTRSNSDVTALYKKYVQFNHILTRSSRKSFLCNFMFTKSYSKNTSRTFISQNIVIIKYSFTAHQTI